MHSTRFLVAVFLFFSCFSCSKYKPIQAIEIAETSESGGDDMNFNNFLASALYAAQLPESLSSEIIGIIGGNPSFILDLFEILQIDPYLYVLVDKEHSLAEDYEPEDLTELKNGSYRVNRTGLFLRKAAVASLEEMAAAARNEGFTLTASSAYRSYNYQVQVYERNVKEMGQQAADRESARPGHSQHQLGLVIDFGSITDAFARTPEGIWLSANASRFGWSLSYPEGYEDVTGYRWESWHYRYVGRELAEFIDNYFNGIQQYALRFIHEFKRLSAETKN
jgi:zinc D-Ala-D-Ala carboxypeptidase